MNENFEHYQVEAPIQNRVWIIDKQKDTEIAKSVVQDIQRKLRNQENLSKKKKKRKQEDNWTREEI